MESRRETLNIEYSKLRNSKNIEYSIPIIKSKRNKKSYSSRQAMDRALYLVNKFKNSGGLLFYLKCAWNLTDEYIDWLVEYSHTKKEPEKYFVGVASMEMTKNGS